MSFELSLTLNNNKIEVFKHDKITKDLKVFSLKMLICLEFEGKTADNPDRMLLYLDKVVLENGKKLSDYDIKDKTSIKVVAEEEKKEDPEVVLLDEKQKELMLKFNERVDEYNYYYDYINSGTDLIDIISQDIKEKGERIKAMVDDKVKELTKKITDSINPEMTKAQRLMKPKNERINSIQNECIKIINDKLINKNIKSIKNIDEKTNEDITKQLTTKIDNALKDYKELDEKTYEEVKSYNQGIELNEKNILESLNINFNIITLPMHGWSNEIVHDFDIRLLNTWNRGYYEYYSHKTRDTTLEEICPNDDNIAIFVGTIAKTNPDKILLGAFGCASILHNNTTNIYKAEIPEIFKDTNYKVYWYKYKNKSFGFSNIEKVNLCSADIEDRYNNTDKLSWHIQGSGGWRSGKLNTLDSSTSYHKVIYWKKMPNLKMLLKGKKQESEKVQT